MLLCIIMGFPCGSGGKRTYLQCGLSVPGWYHLSSLACPGLSISLWVSVTELFAVLTFKALNPPSLRHRQGPLKTVVLSAVQEGACSGQGSLWGCLSLGCSPSSSTWPPPPSFWGPSGTGAQGGTDHLSDLQVENKTKVILLLWVSQS